MISRPIVDPDAFARRAGVQRFSSTHPFRRRHRRRQSSLPLPPPPSTPSPLCALVRSLIAHGLAGWADWQLERTCQLVLLALARARSEPNQTQPSSRQRRHAAAVADSVSAIPLRPQCMLCGGVAVIPTDCENAHNRIMLNATVG